jgi:hypothetical protein
MNARVPAALLLAVIAASRGDAQQVSTLTFPRTVTSLDGSQVTVYQPQVDAWKNYVELDYHAAVEVRFAGEMQPVPGAVELTAQTSADLGTHTVSLYNQRIVSASFPSQDALTSQRLRDVLQSMLPSSLTLSMDQLHAYQQAAVTTPASAAPGVPPAAPAAPAPRTVDVPQSPPTIYYATSPVVLLMYDGDPLFGPIKGTDLLFTINANWTVLQPKDGSTWYLLADSAWYGAPSATGPFSPAGNLPPSFNTIPRDSGWAEVAAQVPGRTLPANRVPRVIVTTTPAEVIVVDGTPQLVAIPKTKLSYVGNTTSDLFKYAPTNTWYFLVSGRWFSTANLANGPWAYASADLPADFRQIPADGPRGSVLASVPGTPQAQQAVAMAQMPQKAEVQRDVTVSVTYAGQPEFAPIPNTAMSYATNTSYEVVQVGTTYYVCHNAVWFTGPSPTGPFTVATTVPQVIYTIPPSVPVYNVTYVQVYETTPSTVVVGYTSGYMGAYVSPMGVMMFGTGMYYAYHPYYPYGMMYPMYYPHPMPYGYAAAYNPYTGAFVHGGGAYGPYGGYGYGSSYNPATGTYARGAAAYGPYGSAAAGRAYNPYTGASAASYQRSTPYASWGQSAVSKNGEWAQGGHYSNSQGTVAGVQTSQGGKAAGVSTAYGTTTAGKTANNDMYATHDGNVYKNTGSGWQSYNNGSWNSVQQPSTAAKPTSSSAAASSASAQAAGAKSAGTMSSENASSLQKDQAARSTSAGQMSNGSHWNSGDAGWSGSGSHGAGASGAGASGGGRFSGGGGGFSRGGGGGRR